MRILHITPTYYPATYWGGPIFSVFALNNSLSNINNVDLKVLTTDAAGSNLSERLKTQGLADVYRNYEVIFCRRIFGNSVSVELLSRLVELIRWADVVHVTAAYSFPTIPTLLVCRALGKPLVWSPRGAILEAYEWDRSRKRRLKRLWEWVCNVIVKPNSVLLHVTSEDERIASLARIPHAQAQIIPNGVDTLAFLPERNWIPEGRLRLVFMGRLSPKKGIENLLKAMKQLESDETIELIIYGTGIEQYKESLLKLARSLRLLGKSVSFAGHVDGEEKSNAFLNADICIVPSYSENFCMVVAESLAHGVPVIASQGTPWKEVENRNCGLWVRNDPEELARAIVDLRTKDLNAMGHIGWEWMKEDYSWDTIGNLMCGVYDSVLVGEKSA